MASKEVESLEHISGDGSKGKKPLRVLFLPPGEDQVVPWFADVVQAVESFHHTIQVFDQQSGIKEQFEDTDAVIDFGGKLGTHEMADAAAGRVRLWQILGTGFDHFDISYWKKKRIPVANCPGFLSAPPLGDCALMFLLMLARRWHETQQNVQERVLYNPVCQELEGLRLGLIGFGASAREFAKKVQPFKMRVSAIDVLDISPEDREEFALEFVGKPADIDRVVAESDCISLHLHLNRETHHVMDARRIAMMKPNAWLINVARGALVDEKALCDALTAGRIGGAGLDVFESEPVDPNHALLKLPNVVATPHVAGITNGTSRRRAHFAAANIDRLARGLEPLARVDL
jgi:phosphoglycerate dehydrogenase-like enzyme